MTRIATNLPPGLVRYKHTPEFTLESVPSALLSAQRVKASVGADHEPPTHGLKHEQSEQVAAITREPHPNAPGISVGIDEPMIRTLIHTFYARVRVDPLLGPIFNRAIHDWDAHLEKLCAFWSSVTLMTGRYKGTPMKAHAELPEIAPAHFERWLAVFRATAINTCPPGAATVFVDRANRIAESLQLGIALHRGQVIVPPVSKRGSP